MRIKSLALGVALALAWAGAARADDTIGQVKKASGTVSVLHDGKASVLKVGDHVHQSDTIKTDKASSVGITFLDNSMMSLGPASELALTEFKFDSTTRAGVFNTQLNKGTLRVKSGQIVQQTPEAMHIRTPAALLGVRGTEFVVDAGARLMRIAVLGAALLLSACASQGSVVILPPSDGHVGGVVVHPNKGADVVLDKPYAADVPGDGHVTMATAESVDKQFHDAMTAFPKPPKPFTLFFERDSAELTPEISKQFSDVDAFIRQQDQPAEIVITGHTDTSGAAKYNEELSLRRANLVKDLFVTAEGQKRLDDSHITISTAGRGLYDAKITSGVNCKETPDEKSCHDARNVEITVQ